MVESKQEGADDGAHEPNCQCKDCAERWIENHERILPEIEV